MPSRVARAVHSAAAARDDLAPAYSADLELVIALATKEASADRDMSQLLLFLGNVGGYWTEAFILNDGSLIDLRPLVEQL